MSDETEFELPILWPLVGLATVVYFIAAYLWGDPNPEALAQGVPYYMAKFDNGFTNLPKLFMLIPGILVGVGASLGSPSAKQSLVWVAIGALAAIALPVFIAWLDLNIGVFRSSPPEQAGAVSQGLSLIVKPIVAVITAIFYFFLSWLPVLFVGCSTSIIIHLLLDMTAGNPMPWSSLFDGEAEEETLYELGGGVIIFALTLFLLGLIPGLNGRHDTKEAVWNDLQPPFEEGPTNQDAKGRAQLSSRVKELQLMGSRAEHQLLSAKFNCNGDVSTYLSSLNFWFQAIRINEDWKPDQQLSPQSQEVVDLANKALEKKIAGWKDFYDYTQIHLDRKSYEGTVGKCTKEWRHL